MNREQGLASLNETPLWDFIIIGGGATGLGAAVDAASRGFKTLLLEQSDFAKATSSRSTKLIHGGLRYLQQGNISLVTEALHERGLLCQNAPHLVGHRPFLVPSYHWWEGPFYGMGLKVYDLLAGELGLKPSRSLSKEEVLARMPQIETEGLRGGSLYYDGQFDDARLALTLARTAADLGATLLNYVRVENFIEKEGQIVGVVARDLEDDKKLSLQGRCIINATGIFCDALRQKEDAAQPSWLRPSQGSHLVFARELFDSETALLVPHTADGRVLFIVPWHGKLLIGTTDTPHQSPDLEPIPLESEIDFILDTAGRYLTRKPTRADIFSCFAGLRPLFSPQGGTKTKNVARDHHIARGSKGLISICGGKWTTYRKMAEDLIDFALNAHNLPFTPSPTAQLKLQGYLQGVDPEDPWSPYGSDREAMIPLMQKEPDLATLIDPNHSTLKVQVIWACEHEMARHVEDVLARRTRTLFLDAKAAYRMARPVATVMAQALKKDQEWIEKEVTHFQSLAENYFIS